MLNSQHPTLKKARVTIWSALNFYGGFLQGIPTGAGLLIFYNCEEHECQVAMCKTLNRLCGAMRDPLKEATDQFVDLKSQNTGGEQSMIPNLTPETLEAVCNFCDHVLCSCGNKVVEFAKDAGRELLDLNASESVAAEAHIKHAEMK